jgi:ABC-type transport system substrate-binding protein
VAPEISSAVEQTVAADCVDNLVEYDHLGIMKPSLATSWAVSPDGLHGLLGYVKV